MKHKLISVSALLLLMLLLVACTAPAESPAPAADAAMPAAFTPAAEPTPEERREADTWDLTEYFADDAAFDAELAELRSAELPAFTEMAAAVCDPETLLSVQRYSDAVTLRLDRLQYYAAQKKSLNATDSTAQMQANAAALLAQDFSLVNTAFTNRLLSMDDAFWTAVFADEALSPYWRQLQKMRDNAAHTLSDSEEALLMPAYQAEANLTTTFTLLDYANLSWPTVTDPDGNAVTADYTNYTAAMLHPDRAYRKAFYTAFMGPYSQYRDTFASNLNAYTTLTEQVAVLHRYDCLLDSVMQGGGLTPEIYDALLQAGRNGTDVLAREAALRKAALGVDELYPYDSSVPLCDVAAPTYSYAEAQALIQSALAPLGQDYTDTLALAFQNRWIDVYPAENKDTGAYSGMAVDIHPWVLTNFTGTYASVSTLSHELGHAVHQYRSYAAQESAFQKNPSSLVSEVASTCNELLLSRYMIEHAASKEEKLYYVQQELRTLKSTFFGQIAYADFERQYHACVENGQALTADSLDALYAENAAVYSPGYMRMDVARSYWAAVPHFYYNYYVYSYAMAISVSCVAADAIYHGDAEMLENYRAYLAAGDSADAPALFQMLGVDVTDPGYTKPLLARYAALLDMEAELLGLEA